MLTHPTTHWPPHSLPWQLKITRILYLLYSDDLTQTASQTYFTTLNSCCYWWTSDPEDGLHLQVWELFLLIRMLSDMLITFWLKQHKATLQPRCCNKVACYIIFIFVYTSIHVEHWISNTNNTLPKFIICFHLELHVCTELLHLVLVTFV